MKKYDEIKFKGLDWYVIDTNEDTTRLLLKNTLDEEIIKQCVDDEWYRNGKYVKMSEIVKPPFVWEGSYIYKTVLPKFKAYLNENIGIDLLSKEEIEDLPENIRECDTYYWTKTNASEEDDTFAYAFCVYSDGSVVNNYVNFTYAVRPAVSIATSTLYTKENGDKNLFDERTIPSKINYEDHVGIDLSETVVNTINEIIDYLKAQNDKE